MNILAAYKPTAEGRAALDAAVYETRLRGARLLIARHVRTSDDAGDRDSPSKPWDELEKMARDLRDDGVDCEARLLSGDGDVADELIKAAVAEDIELIVIGVRRRSPVGKAFLGSESQDILLKSPCPVLAVKSPAD